MGQPARPCQHALHHAVPLTCKSHPCSFSLPQAGLEALHSQNVVHGDMKPGGFRSAPVLALHEGMV